MDATTLALVLGFAFGFIFGMAFLGYGMRRKP
jgi:hypothetical protein